MVRASICTESEAAQDDLALLSSFGPAASKPDERRQDMVLKDQAIIDSAAQMMGTVQPIGNRDRQEQMEGGEMTKPLKSLKKKIRSEDLGPEGSGSFRAKKGKKTGPSSSEDSDVSSPKKKKSKKKHQKKKRPSPSLSSSSTSSSSEDSKTSSSDSSSSVDSDDEENAELCYDVTEFQLADLPDLPDKWDKGFKKLRSYVPLTLFRISLLEAYYDDEKEVKAKDKLDWSKSSLKNLEKQLTYGDFIEMSDLEERYAREIYGLDTYADYVVQHKKIVSDLKKSYNCWMIGLRYHLKVRTVIFRSRKLIRSKFKGKSVLKDKVKIPNGLQPAIERQARHDADRAGDLQFVDNPYAVGGAKFGHNFATGRQQVPTGTVTVGDRTGDGNQSSGFRGRRGTGYKRPFAKKSPYPYIRYNRQHSDAQPGM